MAGSDIKKSSDKRREKTPLMRQYHEIKEQYPGTLLLFRVGDFYETFSEDAVTISRELGITLTRRNNAGDQTPLAGFPYHALDSYLPRLVKKGHRVAVCDQAEDPAQAKAAGRKLVNREISEIVTPGVTLSDKVLERNRNNYIASLHAAGERYGVAFADISTGEFAVTEVSADELAEVLASISPSEILLSKRAKASMPESLGGYTTTWMEEWIYEGKYGYDVLLEHFRTHSLKGFGVEELEAAHVAAGALLHYVRENQKASLGHLRSMYAFENSGYMMLDPSTKRNLELMTSLQQGGKEGTLISILDETGTPMGSRMLRKWLMRPLKQLEEIRNRIQAVEVLHIRHDLRRRLHEILREIGDLERLVSRICVKRANARELKQLQDSLSRIPEIKEALGELEEPLLVQIRDQLEHLGELQDRIDAALVDDPPAGLRDGGFIREGYSPELDEIRDIARNGKEYVARIQKELVESTGIPSLKLGYNKVFGYYIEVTNAHKEKVPEEFIRKQTLVNAERYITPELKEVEEKILSSEERSQTLEQELFQELLEYVAGHAGPVQQNADALARIDCLQSLAEVAYRYNYVKPKVNGGSAITIRGGRHPVVERSLPRGEPFIPNDITLDTEKQQILMITGPNMAGKSIILRQTGLIVLLAQVGSFVPAKEAEIGLVDKIFTRVGASDNLAAGESTFLVEMNEAANILNNASPRSLILLDEIGRGTSTFDGLSIAWSLAEYLHNQPSVAARTLFATHYHELNELEELYERIVNYNVQVKEHKGKIIFLRKLVRGGADHSYGIQVAAMAGLPELLIHRAREILGNLESHSLDVTRSSGTMEKGAAGKKKAAQQAVRKIGKQPQIPQMSLFQAELDPNLETVKNKLEGADPNRMTPVEALMLLAELKRTLESRDH
ncbi:DNA mismatch repair protein MutS [Balneolales bacterium ANBcel1]|nr:DNA mismatch repair protein MutS [Balneolales bacterium ANBcel1]